MIWSLALIVVACARPVEIALRRVDVGVAERGAQVVDVQPIGGERARIDLDAHRRALAAADADQADAGLLRDLLRQPRVGQILDLSVSGSVFEVSASVRIGASAGLTLA